MSGEQEHEVDQIQRRRAKRTALLLAVIAIFFYAGIFLLAHWRSVH